MIVKNIGYLSIYDLEEMHDKKDLFCIYETNKKRNICIKNTEIEQDTLYFVKKDRLPWKVTEGKKICFAKKIFSSIDNDWMDIGKIKLNNDNQIISYEEYQY